MKKKLLHTAMSATANTSSATHLSGLLCGQPLYTAANAAAAGVAFFSDRAAGSSLKSRRHKQLKCLDSKNCDISMTLAVA